MNLGICLGLGLALCSVVPAGPVEPVAGDFNQDQQLDQADLALLLAAVGSADPLFDLNVDGRVDLEDFFRWADHLEAAPAFASAPDSTAPPDSIAALPSPTDTLALGPVPLVVAPAVDTVAVVAGASPIPDSIAALPSPTDTLALGPAPPDSPQAVAPPVDTVVVVADSSVAAVLPVDTAASPPRPDSAAVLLPSRAQLPANMDPQRLSAVLPPPDHLDTVPTESSVSPLPPAPPPPLLPEGAVVLPDSARPFQSVPVAYYAVTTTRHTTAVHLTGYTVAIHNANPFGISSLRLVGQSVDFAHPSLPLGDWEWFWFSDSERSQAKVKLLEQRWQTPEVARSDTGVVLRFRRRDVLRRGIEVEVRYHLDARRPEITAEYTIRNHSGQPLLSPYMMVGFPGFANQQWVEQVSTAEKVRRPLRPYADFLAEAQARKLTDYLLLRQDWNPQTQAPEALQGSVALRAAGRTYTLTTTLAGASGLIGAYIAHTNKPRYLTSHLYAFLDSLGDGQSGSVAVRYVLAGSR